MRALEIVNTAARKFGAAVATAVERARARNEFTCGDCERWERCGLSPHETCVIKLAQLARYDRRAPSRYILPRW